MQDPVAVSAEYTFSAQQECSYPEQYLQTSEYMHSVEPSIRFRMQDHNTEASFPNQIVLLCQRMIFPVIPYLCFEEPDFLLGIFPVMPVTLLQLPCLQGFRLPMMPSSVSAEQSGPEVLTVHPQATLLFAVLFVQYLAYHIQLERLAVLLLLLLLNLLHRAFDSQYSQGF